MEDIDPRNQQRNAHSQLPGGESAGQDHELESPQGTAHGQDSQNTFANRVIRFLVTRLEHWKHTCFHDRVNIYLSFVIAVSTTIYAIVAWRTLSEIHSSSVDTHALAEATKTQALLQARIARLDYAILDLTPWMYFHWQGDKMLAEVVVYNKGKSPADSIQIAAKVDILDSRPSEYNVGKFEVADLTFLPAFNPSLPIPNPAIGAIGDKANPAAGRQFTMDKRISPTQHSAYIGRTVYVWGKIRYRDFIEEWEDLPFCRFAKVDLIFQQPDGSGHIAGLESNCTEKTENPKQ